jgi:hypothetical protein
MKKIAIQILMLSVGVGVGIYASAFIATRAWSAYSPTATSFDSLVLFSNSVWLISSLVLGSLLGYLGFKLGGRLCKSDKA